jgi:hypothetical protein
MNKQNLKTIGLVLLFFVCIAAIGLGGTGFFVVLSQSIRDFSTTKNMDQSIGWEIFFWLLIGVPSVVLCVSGVGGVITIWSVWQKRKKLVQSVPPLPPAEK